MGDVEPLEESELMKAARFEYFRDIYQVVWSDAGPFVKARLSIASALVATASVLTALGPLPLKLIVDDFTGKGGAARVTPLALVLLFASSQFLVRALNELRGIIYARAERRMLRVLSERLFAHLMKLPLRFHLDRQTGALSQSLDLGLQGYQIVLHHLVFTVLPVTIELVTVVFVLARLTSPTLVAIYCGAIVCYGLTFVYAATAIAKSAKTASAATVDASATMTEGVLNYETIKYFTAESMVQESVSRALARAEADWVTFYRRFAQNGLCVATIYGAFLGATILFAARDVQTGRMTIGDFVLVNSYTLQVLRPVEMLGYAMQGFAQGTAMLQRMLEFLRQMQEPQWTDGCVQAAGPGAIEFDNVSLSYCAEHSVLKDLSFKIPAGKTLGIVGPSGSGKSTVVRLAVRFFEPDSGRILLGGVPINDLPLAKLRRSIAVVPQDTVLFNATVGYNIALGRPNCSCGEIEEAARLAQVHEFIMSLPDRYDTIVGERGVKLSGGEKQRVAIARAVIKRPEIYVFDEATSSLDSRTEGEILRGLREISRVTTTLIVAHRLSTVVHADEILVLDAGRIVERGSHETLVTQNGEYAALWRAQHHDCIALPGGSGITAFP
jgi:ABC-type transport system involved in Fe-S cluster assembly fused permease/ATPase subunit